MAFIPCAVCLTLTHSLSLPLHRHIPGKGTADSPVPTRIHHLNADVHAARLARLDDSHPDEQHTDAKRGDDTDGTPARFRAYIPGQVRPAQHRADHATCQQSDADKPDRLGNDEHFERQGDDGEGRDRRDEPRDQRPAIAGTQSALRCPCSDDEGGDEREEDDVMVRIFIIILL